MTTPDASIRASSPLRVACRIFLTYLAAAILSLAAFIWFTELWRADLRVPFRYAAGNDFLFNHLLVKSIDDHGWFLHNPSIGLPTGLYLHDWPVSDNLPLFLIKVISLWTDDSGLILNLYFILTFPLTTFTALWAFRALGASNPPAIAGALLYTFTPAHFLRGESHLFLATYFLVPPLIVLIVWIARQEPLLRTGRGKWGWLRSKACGATLICILAGAGNSYHIFFGAFLLLAAGLIAWFRNRQLRCLFASMIFLGVMLTSFVANLAPSVLHIYEHGNINAAERRAYDTERRGLKLTNLLLPLSDHRWPAMARIRKQYDNSIPPQIRKYNRAGSIGAVGSLGFLLLLGSLLGLEFPAGKTEDYRYLAQLSLATFLLATIGGFSSLFSVFVSPQIRAYNRINIYISFLALICLVWLYDGLTSKLTGNSFRRPLRWIGVIAVTTFGLLDQVTPRSVPVYQSNNRIYGRDAAFVRKVEAKLPEGAMIFQLPYLPFPRTPAVQRMNHYDHLRPYLHSRSVRWSFGAMHNREADFWQRQVSAEPLNSMVKTLKEAGFAAIYVDKFAYQDSGMEIAQELRSLTGKGPLMSGDHRFLLFDLRFPYDDHDEGDIQSDLDDHDEEDIQSDLDDHDEGDILPDLIFYDGFENGIVRWSQTP